MKNKLIINSLFIIYIISLNQMVMHVIFFMLNSITVKYNIIISYLTSKNRFIYFLLK